MQQQQRRTAALLAACLLVASLCIDGSQAGNLEPACARGWHAAAHNCTTPTPLSGWYAGSADGMFTSSSGSRNVAVAAVPARKVLAWRNPFASQPKAQAPKNQWTWCGPRQQTELHSGLSLPACSECCCTAAPAAPLLRLLVHLQVSKQVHGQVGEVLRLTAVALKVPAETVQQVSAGTCYHCQDPGLGCLCCQQQGFDI